MEQARGMTEQRDRSDVGRATALGRGAEKGPLVRTEAAAGTAARAQRNGHGGAVVWLTGLSGAGKSTMASALERALFDRHMQVFVLDGDNIRLGLSSDLGFSADDRSENVRRIAEVARLFADAGLIAITAFISPYVSDRARARAITQAHDSGLPFIEVFIDAPLSVCEARDPTGLYARARDGRIQHFTGVTDPYEPPEAPEVILRTGEHTVAACLDQLLAYLLPRVGAADSGAWIAARS
jgi:adenylyl-sulfate kinase